MVPLLFVAPPEPVDGVNCVFTVSADYVPGTTIVFVNGLARRRGFVDGWIEAPPKQVVMGLPPQVGEVVQVLFRPL